MIKLIFTFLFIFSMSCAVLAQPADKTFDRKIAFYNRYAFYDDKTGIKKLVDADRSAGNYGFIADVDEKKIEKAYKVRFEVLVEPVLNEIKAMLKQVEIQNNIIILDGSELENKGNLLALDLRLDVTKEFIAYFNNKPKNPAAVLKLDIPESKIGSINTMVFYDKDKGINGLSGLNIDSVIAKDVCDDKTICPQIEKSLAQIYKSMQEYNQKEGFSFILDSSKAIPAELNGFAIIDITQKFISQYNRNNQ